MPTNTFFNLSNDKKEKLLKAAVMEFSRVPYEEVSINQIIKDAEISRGSFYMYFENKLDLLFFLLKDFFKTLFAHATKAFDDSNYDPFVMFEAIYDFIDDYCCSKNKRSFFLNLFSRLRIGHDEDYMSQVYTDLNEMISKDYLLLMMSQSIYNITSAQQSECVLEILFMITKTNTVRLMIEPSKSNEIKDKLLMEFDIIKRGICRTTVE